MQLVRGPSPVEAAILSASPYQRNDAALHTGPEPLPRRRRARASWNCRVQQEPARGATVTYNVNRLQGIPGNTPLDVTLSDFSGNDERRVLRSMRCERRVFTSARATAQARHREVAASNRTSFRGAYRGYGFHEDGVRSAVAACRARDPGSVQ